MADQSLSQLYLVPTPIGNLGDITLRALEVLKNVDLVLAEDTRTTGSLFKNYDINARMKSFHIHNEHKVIDSIVELLIGGQRIALVSDAGTPGISDPGYLLVRAALVAGIKVEVLPGATAFVPALVKSGFPTDRFVFEGFLPHKKGRQTRLQFLAEETRTIILYESPHRLLKLLEQLKVIFGGERNVSVSRELSKLHEETLNGSIEEAVADFSTRASIKGEIVVVLEGKK